MEAPSPFPLIDHARLATLLEGSIATTVLLLDTRTMFDYNAGHIKNAIHMPCSNIMKRRILTDKVKVLEILHLTADFLRNIKQVIVYDTASVDRVCLESFAHIALTKLCTTFPAVFLLKGGYSEFSVAHPDLCVIAEQKIPPCINEPCEGLLNSGPTQIFSHLYLGSEKDAMSHELMKAKGISHVLNVSSSCPKADFISDGNFLRIPVMDTYSEKLICHFMKAFAFLDEVKKNNGCALVHCLAGVSRSPTLAIAYVMKCRNIPYDEAYRYVKEKRPSISPNLNFLGQLMEFGRTENEHRVAKSSALPEKCSTQFLANKPPLIEKCSTQFLTSPCKRQRLTLLRSSSQSGLKLNLTVPSGGGSPRSERHERDGSLSPSTVISRLSLNSPGVSRP